MAAALSYVSMFTFSTVSKGSVVEHSEIYENAIFEALGPAAVKSS